MMRLGYPLESPKKTITSIHLLEQCEVTLIIEELKDFFGHTPIGWYRLRKYLKYTGRLKELKKKV